MHIGSGTSVPHIKDSILETWVLVLLQYFHYIKKDRPEAGLYDIKN